MQLSMLSVDCFCVTCFTGRSEVSHIGTYVTGQNGLFLQGLNITFMTNHNSIMVREKKKKDHMNYFHLFQLRC